MNKLFVSIVVGFLAVGGVLLFQAAQVGTALVLTPSELSTAEEAGRSLSRIRVAGRVAQLPVSYSIEPEIRLEFSIHDPGPAAEEGELSNNNDTTREGDGSDRKVAKVIYEGLKPDMFAPGRDVIIDGEFRGGVLYASNLLTQCPSKYQPPSPVAEATEGAQKSSGYANTASKP